jgi:cell division protein FtsI (penicillin-binding protein 3)
MHDHYRGMATEEHWRQTAVPPRRGDLLDTTGLPLATTVTYESVYASTSEIRSPSVTAAALTPIIGGDPTALTTLLSKKRTAPTLVQRWLAEDKANEIKKLALDGIFLQLEPKRVYPQGALGAQILGVVGVDNNGLSGLELRYDRDLAGKEGSVVAERDTGGSAIAFSPQLYQAPIDGEALTLTIDRYIQWVAERELTAAVKAHQARGGSVVVVEPRTGAILASASLPTLNPDDPDLYSAHQVALYGIPAVSRALEPGTIFNVFTVASALDAGEVTPQTTFYNDGTLSYVGVTITDAKPHAPGPMTVLQSLAFSSNVGASWIGTKIGAYRYYQSLSRLQLGRQTGVDLPGEVDGLLRMPTDLDWSAIDLATNSSGVGLSVTPIQLAAATAAIANDGISAKPFIVRQIGSLASTQLNRPEGGAAIRPEAARALTGMLQAIVDDQTTIEGRLAHVPGYALAGKAGSAVIPDSTSSTQTSAVATFVGFGPTERPRFAIVVQIEAARDGVSPDEITAPVFNAIARQILNYYQIPPSRPVAANGT